MNFKSAEEKANWANVERGKLEDEREDYERTRIRMNYQEDDIYAAQHTMYHQLDVLREAFLGKDPEMYARVTECQERTVMAQNKLMQYKEEKENCYKKQKSTWADREDYIYETMIREEPADE